MPAGLEISPVAGVRKKSPRQWRAAEWLITQLLRSLASHGFQLNLVSTFENADTFAQGVHFLVGQARRMRLQLLTVFGAFKGLRLHRNNGGVNQFGLVRDVTICMLIQPFPQVDSLMGSQVSAPAEAVPALAAFVGFLARVDPLVGVEDRLLAEALAALHADVRLLPRVDPPMLDQRGQVAEALAAKGAAVGLLPRVDPLMGGQEVATDEALPALQALVRFLPGMDSQVDLQARLVAEEFPANVALVFSLFGRLLFGEGSAMESRRLRSHVFLTLIREVVSPCPPQWAYLFQLWRLGSVGGDFQKSPAVLALPDVTC